MLGIEELITKDRCKKCIALQETLEYERGQKEYFTKLLMARSGIIVETPDNEIELENYPSIRHSTTLSQLRKMAISASIRRSEESKEAREKFEREVESVSRK